MGMTEREHTREDREDPREYAKEKGEHYSNKGSHKKRSDYWKAERKVNEKEN